MANAEGITPSRHEVERQLERILADNVTASYPQPAKLLKFIVERTLAGEEITEKLIREYVFPNPPYKVESNIARVTMDTVRKLLKNYCRSEGEHDPVVIALPTFPKRKKRIKLKPGEAYTPSFSYNPLTWAAKELTVAYHLLRGSPAQIRQALEHLNNVGRAEPDNPEVMLGTIEAWGMMIILGVVGDPHETLVAGPLWWIDKIEKEGRPTWRTHALRAVLYYSIGDRVKAKAEFERALELNREATISRGMYLHFLFHTGKEEQALRLMAMQAEERADSAPMHAIYGIYLSHAHRHEEAERALAKSLLLDRNCWPAHYGMTQMYLALGNQEKTEEHGKRLEALVEPAEFEDLKRRLTQKARER